MEFRILPGQPGSPTFRLVSRRKRECPPIAAFAESGFRLWLPFLGSERPSCQKSPAQFAKIPVSWRLFPDELDAHARLLDKRALARGLFQCIAQLRNVRSSFDVAFIYLPPAWAACFQDESFDFHDYLKAFCAPSNIPVQIVRQSSFEREPRECHVGHKRCPLRQGWRHAL